MDIVPQLIINSIIAGSIYSIVALGFNLIFGTVKFFDLSYGISLAIGGYSVFFLAKSNGLNIYGSIIAGVIIAGFAGFLFDKLVYRQLRKRKASNMVFLVASLGLSTSFQAIIAILFSSQFQIIYNIAQKQRVFNLFGGIITDIQIYIVITGIISVLLIFLFLKYSLFGKTVKAVSDDEEVSKIIGINTENIIGKIYFISSGIAGIAGILVGFDIGIEPIMGTGLLFKGVIASIIGGVGNIYGGIMGSFLLGFVENVVTWKISGEWKDAVAFTLFIFFLIFRPRGILNK